MTNLDYQAWRCKHDDSLFCPDEGCSKADGCAREKFIPAPDGRVARPQTQAERDAMLRMLEEAWHAGEFGCARDKAVAADLDRLRKPIEAGELADFVAALRANVSPSVETSFAREQRLKSADLLDRLARENERLRAHIAEGIVSLCVCSHSKAPRPDCECVTCTVKRSEARAELLAEALRALHDDCVEYSRINKLGGENNHVLVQARTALATLSPKAEEK